MDAKTAAIWIGIGSSLVGAGVSLGQQWKETEISEQRITDFKTVVQDQMNAMRLELSTAKTDRELLIRMDERLKAIESAVKALNAPRRRNER